MLKKNLMLLVYLLVLIIMLTSCAPLPTGENTPPIAPTVTGETLTNTNKPTWTWNAVSGAIVYRHRLSNNMEWLTSPEKEYTPGSPLADGKHTLFVQAGKLSSGKYIWSESGSFETEIDTVPPGDPAGTPPTITGETPTTNLKPTWTWNQVVDTDPNVEYAIKYKCILIENEVLETETTETEFTPQEDLEVGNHTLFVQAGDEAGNWTEPGSFTIVINTGK